jgi:hypothetical protein
VGSLAAQRTIPCWPNPSRAVVFFTKGVGHLTSDLIFQLPFVFVILFVFDDFIGRLLHSIGYDSLILLQAQYLYVSSRLADIRFVDFQVLEITIWLSIAIWGSRFILGFVFLKQYDRFFMMFSEPHKIKVYGLFILGILGVYFMMNVKFTVAARLIFALMKYFPRAYFVLIATFLFWYLWMISVSLLFIVWKIFRQNRRGAVLWSGKPQQKGC